MERVKVPIIYITSRDPFSASHAIAELVCFRETFHQFDRAKSAKSAKSGH